MEFAGAKLALFLGTDLLVIRRDNRPDIPFPDHLDLPGGGREADETPIECALRETREEVGLVLRPDEIVWTRTYDRENGSVWFFVAHRPAEHVQQVRFGSEGQGWSLMSARAFIDDPMTVPHFRDQLQHYLDHGADPAHGRIVSQVR
ncbi:MAG: NUDIX hydrolase [Pseudomonadota bacterium]